MQSKLPPRGYYTASGKRKLLTVVYPPVRGVSTRSTRNVTGRRQARELCAAEGVTCWNF